MEEKLILEMLDSPYVETRLLAVEFLSQAQEPSIAAILRAMEDEVLPVRKQAVSLASQHFPTEHLIGFVGNHGNAILRNSAIEALTCAGQRSVKGLLGALAHEDHEVIMFATQILGDIQGPVSPKPLLKLLSHSDSNVSQAAIETLGKLQIKEAVPRLLEILESDFWLQFAAIAALGEIKDPRAIPRLLPLLEDEFCQSEVLKALGNIGDLETLSSLIELWEKTDKVLFRDQLTLAVARIASKHPAASKRMESFFQDSFQEKEKLSQARNYLLGALGSLPKEGLVSQPETELRNAAIYWLTHLPGNTENLTPLVAQLQDPLIRETLLSSFSQIEHRAIPALQQGLRHEAPDVRRFSAYLLGQLGDKSLLEDLASLLKDPIHEIRYAATEALGNLGGKEVIPLLLPLLSEQDPELQDVATRALARMKRDILVPMLASYLTTATGNFCSAALELVALVPDKQFTPFLRKALQSSDPQVVRAAIRAATQSEEIDLLQEVSPLLESQFPAVRVQAIDALGTSENKAAIDLLLPRLHGPEAEQYFIVRALGDLQAESSIDIILENFESFATRIRLAAIEALGQIGGVTSETFLIRCLEGPFPEERRAAAAALAQQKSPTREELFLSLAKDADWRLRNVAAYALGSFVSNTAKETLKRLVQDKESVVARTALEAKQRQMSIKASTETAVD